MDDDFDPAKIPGALVTVDEARALPWNQRVVTAEAFMSLWTDDEIAAATAASSTLNIRMLRALSKGSVNLDSPDLPMLLALAVSKGALTAARAEQIKAGTPPAP